MSGGRQYLEWIRLSIRHREEELELLRKMESDAAPDLHEAADPGTDAADDDDADNVEPGSVEPDKVARNVPIGDRNKDPDRVVDETESAAEVESRPAPDSTGGQGWTSQRGIRDEADGQGVGQTAGESTPSQDLPEFVRPHTSPTGGSAPRWGDSEERSESTGPETSEPSRSTFPSLPYPLGRAAQSQFSEPEEPEIPDDPHPPGDLHGPEGPVASAVTPTPREHAGKEAHERAVYPTDDTSLAESENGVHTDGTDATDATDATDVVDVADDPSGHVAIPEAPEPEPAVESVLLMEQDGCWVGFPWHEVDRVALTEEIPIGSGHRFRFSLRDLLADRVEQTEDSWKHRPTESEPFAVLWKRDHALSLLCCRRFGGITSTEKAVERRVEWMIRPPRLGEGREPQIVRMSEVLALKPTTIVETPSPVVRAETPSPAVQAETPSPAVRAETPNPVTPAEAPSPVASVETPRPAVPAETPSPVIPVETSGPNAPVDTPRPGSPVGLKPIESGGRLRVLLAVPYLPVRVALSRSFLQADWEVTEESNPLRVCEAISDSDYDAIFLDLADPMDPGLAKLLEEERFAGLALVAIGSRFQRPYDGASGRLAEAPRLQFPFQDDDVGRIVESLSRR